MKTRSCFALVLTSALAIGCAAARAQDAQDAPPPGPQPQGPPPDAVRRPHGDPAEMKRHMQTKLAEIEKKLAEVEAVKERTEETRRQAEQLRFHADRIRDHIAQIDRGEMPGPMGPGGPDGRRPQPMGPDGRPPLDDRPRRMRERVVDAQGRELDARVVGRGPMHGPGSSVEQRLEMLERAVREMHDLFQRHGVPPEARERAEREMRDRRDERRPGEGPGPGPGPRPEMGGPPPMGDGREQKPPRPPMPRPGMPKFEMSDAEKAEVKSFIAAKEAEMAAHMKEFAQQMEEMKRQLVETRAALEKAQAEVERLRAENAGK